MVVRFQRGVSYSFDFASVVRLVDARELIVFIVFIVVIVLKRKKQQNNDSICDEGTN